MTNEILTRIINFNLFCHFSCKYPYHYINIGTKIEAHIVLIVALFQILSVFMVFEKNDQVY